MSYSFREPEWPALCECKYDEARDEMDREDCPFHCDWGDAEVLESVTSADEVRPVTRKRPTRAGDVKELEFRLRKRKRSSAAALWNFQSDQGLSSGE